MHTNNNKSIEHQSDQTKSQFTEENKFSFSNKNENNNGKKLSRRNRFLIVFGLVGLSSWLFGKLYLKQDTETAVSLYIYLYIILQTNV